MKTTAAKPMSQIERYILLTFGVLLTAVGVYFFKFPNNFSTGGVSGLSLILGRVFPSPVLTPSAFVFIINMALLVVGFIFLGRSFAFSTVYCSVVLSLAVNVMERFWPLDHPLTNQPLLELCFAVLLPAIGSAILFHLDASSGGTDIVAAWVRKKHPEASLVWLIFSLNAAVAVLSFFVYGCQFEPVILCLIYCYLSSSISDTILKGGKSAMKFEVVTRQPEELSRQLMQQLRHGVTVLQAEGMYSETPRSLLICVVNRHQVVRFQEILARFPDTFACVSSVNETWGNFKHVA